MARSYLFIYLFLITCVSAQKLPYEGLENEFTITLEHGATECFYQKTKAGDTLEVEYQVIDVSFGDVEFQQDLDINFYVYAPAGGKELIADYKKADAAHRIEIKETGDYKFCFDNSYSVFSRKKVYFEVYIDSDSEDYNEKWDEFEFSPELLYNDTMDQIKISIAKVREDLVKIKHHQDQLRAIESRDRNLQEHNFTRVNQFSMLFIAVMIIVGAVQVVMVRSLFEEQSKLHKIFKLLS